MGESKAKQVFFHFRNRTHFALAIREGGANLLFLNASCWGDALTRALLLRQQVPMVAESPSGISLLVSFLTGSVFAALLSEFFRRRRLRTRTIKLFEIVNRDPLLYELKGTKLVREGPEGHDVEVKNIRHYQLLLRNTSDVHLRGAQIQFEFHAAEDVVPWVSRPVKSNAPLIPVQPSALQLPSQRAFRWEMPQFPPGDSTEFGFQVVNPSSEEYVAFLDSSENVVLEKKSGPPDDRPVSSKLEIAILVLGGALAAAAGSWLSDWRGLSKDLEESNRALAEIQELQRNLYNNVEEPDTVVADGKKLFVASRVKRTNQGWTYSYEVNNVGSQTAVVLWKDRQGSVILKAELARGKKASAEMVSPLPPRPDLSEFFIGEHPAGFVRTYRPRVFHSDVK